MQHFILLASLKQSSFDFYDAIPSCFVVFGFSPQLSGYSLSSFAIFFFLCLLVPLRVLPSHLISFGHPGNSLYTLMTIISSSLSQVYEVIKSIITWTSLLLSPQNFQCIWNIIYYFISQTSSFTSVSYFSQWHYSHSAVSTSRKSRCQPPPLLHLFPNSE